MSTVLKVREPLSGVTGFGDVSSLGWILAQQIRLKELKMNNAFFVLGVIRAKDGYDACGALMITYWSGEVSSSIMEVTYKTLWVGRIECTLEAFDVIGRLIQSEESRKSMRVEITRRIESANRVLRRGVSHV